MPLGLLLRVFRASVLGWFWVQGFKTEGELLILDVLPELSTL